MRSSYAYADAITGRNAGVTLISAAYLFSNPNRAESDLEDVENALLHTRKFHADVEKNYSDENILTYELTVGFSPRGIGNVRSTVAHRSPDSTGWESRYVINRLHLEMRGVLQ